MTDSITSVSLFFQSVHLNTLQRMKDTPLDRIEKFKLSFFLKVDSFRLPICDCFFEATKYTKLSLLHSNLSKQPSPNCLKKALFLGSSVFQVILHEASTSEQRPPVYNGLFWGSQGWPLYSGLTELKSSFLKPCYHNILKIYLELENFTKSLKL
jgi:hypothetical protein